MVNERRPAIDGLRTLAVLAVFGVHAWPDAAPGGYVGVDVFFVISGYVITSLLLKECRERDTIALRRFYANRLWRLGPSLITMTFAISVILPFTNRRSDLRSAPFALTYTTDFVRILDPSLGTVFSHTWSLAVEEQFYLVWPAAIVIIARGSRFAIVKVRRLAIAGAVMSVAISLVYTISRGSQVAEVRIYNGPDTRGVQLLIGCALAAWAVRGVAPKYLLLVRRAAPGAMILLVLWVLSVPNTSYNPHMWIDLPAVAGIAALIVLAASQDQGGMSRFLASPLLSWPGRRLSYAFYLWHFPIVLLLMPKVPAPRALSGLIVLFLAVLASCATYMCVEAPIQRWRASRLLAG